MLLPTAWLAQADHDPDRAANWLVRSGRALLPVGTQWDAVKVPAQQGRAALATGITGPVLRDAANCSTFFLVPPGTSESWDVPDTICLGAGCWLTSPHPATTAPPGPHWLQPPDGRTLVRPSLLQAALTAPVPGATP
ncbi:hypothetical protein AB0H29_08565 [Streptomyces thermolilacinus]